MSACFSNDRERIVAATAVLISVIRGVLTVLCVIIAGRVKVAAP
jgi:hypothetical protein